MKKIALVVLAILLVAAIPLTVFLLQRKQETKSRASASTRFYFAPDTSTTNPLKKNVGDAVTLDLMVDPGNNVVTFVRFQVQFDVNKLALSGTIPFVANTAAFPTMVEGPVIGSGVIAGSLSVGSNPTKALQTITKVGTFTFTALDMTQGATTMVTFGPLSQALSSGANDQAGEDVLATAAPAAIAISQNGTNSLTPTILLTPTNSITPAPTQPITGSPTAIPVPTMTPLPTGETTTVSFTILLDGVGNRGDNPNPGGSSLSNKNPLHPQRNLEVMLFNSNNQQVMKSSVPIIYDGNSGMFSGQMDLGPTFPAGNYNIKIKSDRYLRKLVPGILNAQQLQDNPVPQTALVAGDVNGDNVLNVLDYNALLDCGYGVINPLPMADPNSVFNSQICRGHHVADLVDIDDNGIVNSADYNLFLRELSVQNGD